MNNPAQLLNVIAALKPQQVAAIGVQRGDQAIELKVTIGQRPKASELREE